MSSIFSEKQAVFGHVSTKNSANLDVIMKNIW